MAHPEAGRFLRAAYEGNAGTVRELIAQGVPVDTPNSSGLQALHFAAKTGNTELAHTLIKHGAQVNAATQKGNTPLHVASLYSKTEFVKLLLSYHADVNALSTSNQDQFSPLYMAAQIGQQEIVTLLLAYGADINFATKNGATPKLVAFQQGHKAVGELLEEYENRVNKDLQRTPTKSLSNGHGDRKTKSNSKDDANSKHIDETQGAVGGIRNGRSSLDMSDGQVTPTSSSPVATPSGGGYAREGGAEMNMTEPPMYDEVIDGAKMKEGGPPKYDEIFGGAKMKIGVPPIYDELLPSPRASPRRINSRKSSLVDK